MTFRESYEPLLQRLLRREVEETNARTGATISVLHHDAHFNVDLTDGAMPLCGIRRMYPGTAAAEVAWFLSGEQDSTFIRRHAPIWDKFVEEDGVTVLRAYGYRWRRHFGRDQLGDAIRTLHRNPTDRRVWVDAWDASDDGLGEIGQLNVPCPVGFSLSIVDGGLNSSLVIRSSDVFVGLPYDVLGHALLVDAVASELDVRPGVLGFTLCHPHLYSIHFDLANNALSGRPSDVSAPLLGWTVSGITEDPEGYVKLVRDLHAAIPKADRPSYSCRPEVVA